MPESGANSGVGKVATTYPSLPVVVVDDEAMALQGVMIALKSNGIDHVVLCQDGRDLSRLLSSHGADVVLLDLTMPLVSGEELLGMVTVQFPDVPVIVLTGNDDLNTAVRCMKSGAFDYLVKPVARERLVSSVRHAIDRGMLLRENRALKDHLLSSDLKRPEVFAVFDAVSPAMKNVFKYAESIATSPEPVLITGGTGSGKELMARCIHQLSGREGALVSVNVAGLDDNAFSDTLFGHVRGAFTGAMERRSGLVEKAAGGTLFLDEIGELSATLQVKLLRLMQEREYFPLGSDLPKRCEARIVCATNVPVAQLAKSERFRPDLFYRMKRHHVHLPLLRERREDLPQLVQRIVRETAERLGKPCPVVSARTVALLSGYGFPGNVRELEAMITEAVSAQVDGVISDAALCQWMSQNVEDVACDAGVGSETVDEAVAGDGVAGVAVEVVEEACGIVFDKARALPSFKSVQKALVMEAMRRAAGNQSSAAAMLGITRQAINKRIREG